MTENPKGLQKKLLVITAVGFSIIGFSLGITYERSLVLHADQPLKPLTIMQYYSTPELLIKSLNNNEMSCDNLPLEMKQMVNTLQKGICPLNVNELKELTQ